GQPQLEPILGGQSQRKGPTGPNAVCSDRLQRRPPVRATGSPGISLLKGSSAMNDIMQPAVSDRTALRRFRFNVREVELVEPRRPTNTARSRAKTPSPTARPPCDKSPGRSNEAAGIFESHRTRLFAIALRMLGTRADAEDVLQDAYLRWHNAAG